MTGCTFCKIVEGKLPARKVYEDNDVIAFLDINPVKSGHVLIIPKAHYPTMIETPDAVVADIFVEAKKLMGAVKEAMAADFVTLSVVGTDVPHLHIHLTPRHRGDGLTGWPTKKYDGDEMERVAEKIRRAIKKI